ncbi:MAG: hypothetical protein J7M18_00815 [Candidatus Eremiobacteraeota bacterium]|nr:hypothetical protein [Candidatus Eremiobacteraeota bacterium]
MLSRGKIYRSRNAGSTIIIVSIIVILLIIAGGFLFFRFQAIKEEKARIAEENRLKEEKQRERERERARQLENLKKFEKFVEQFAKIDDLYNKANNMRIEALKKSSASEKKKVVDPGIARSRAVFLSIQDAVNNLETVYAFEETASIPDLVRRAINSHNLACEAYIRGYLENDQTVINRAMEDEKTGDASYAKALEYMISAVKKHNDVAKELGQGTYEELENSLQESVEYYRGGKYGKDKKLKEAGEVIPAEQGTTEGTLEKSSAGEVEKIEKAEKEEIPVQAESPSTEEPAEPESITVP